MKIRDLPMSYDKKRNPFIVIRGTKDCPEDHRYAYLPDLIGKGYGAYWKWKGRYRVCKGSRASKKSKTTALWYIVNMMKYPDANLLVVRKVFRTLKDSCFTESS